MSEAATEVRKPKRVATWKIVLVFLGALAVLLIVAVFWISAVGNRRWAAMEKTVRELEAEARGRDSSRPALRGAAVAGNAWDDYAPALKEMDKLKGQDSILGDFISRGPKADRAKVEALLAAHGVALDHLRRGAARSHGQYPIVWKDGFAANIPGLLASQRLANLSACRSRFLVEEGKPREAAELLLDTAQFARDLGFNAVLISEMIALAVNGIAFEELKDVVVAGKLSKEELVEVGRQLDLLERSFPRNGHSMVNEAMMAGWGFIKLEGSPSETGAAFGGDLPAVYGFGFLTRLLFADAFDTHLDFMRRFEKWEDRPWSEVERNGKEAQREIEKLKNPLSKIMVPGLTGSSRAGRERRTQLRLLRVAVHYRATGEVLELDDPFGAKILTSKTGDVLKVWSVGRDGTDQGGVGGWKTGAGADIVLETGK